MIRYTCLAGVGVFVSLSFQSVAQTQSPLDALYACSEIESDSERLACYDGAVGRTKEAETAGEFRTITRQE
ncbi:MAG: hypothetical protein CMK07_06900, partial [Ponticaulis sp.]|nr:hypothetical protein [Ponticaulis sp.]